MARPETFDAFLGGAVELLVDPVVAAWGGREERDTGASQRGADDIPVARG
jgi:hypothetical protein